MSLGSESQQVDAGGGHAGRGALLPDPARTPGPVQPKKIRPLEKKLGLKQAPTPHQLKESSKNLFIQIIGRIFANYC
jgi:hypothetical protein